MFNLKLTNEHKTNILTLAEAGRKLEPGDPFLAAGRSYVELIFGKNGLDLYNAHLHNKPKL